MCACVCVPPQSCLTFTGPSEQFVLPLMQDQCEVFCEPVQPVVHIDLQFLPNQDLIGNFVKQIMITFNNKHAKQHIAAPPVDYNLEQKCNTEFQIMLECEHFSANRLIQPTSLTEPMLHHSEHQYLKKAHFIPNKNTTIACITKNRFSSTQCSISDLRFQHISTF